MPKKFVPVIRKCPECGKVIFIPRAKCCLVCNRERLKRYQRDYRRKYRQNPAMKAREKECRQKPERVEKRREYQREYLKKYYQRPEVKEKIRARQKEYFSRPEIKERQREYYKEYRRKKRAAG